MRIQHNIMAMNAYRNFNRNTSALSKNLEKLSSGYKINRAGDDAAGLAISEKMRAQITGLTQAQSNAKSGINLIQTAEGAMQEVHDMLNRMVKLADQSANGTYDNTTDRKQLQKEVDQLKEEINRIADSSNFNGIKLLDGSLDGNGTGKIADTSAISDILTSEWAAKGASDAFEAKYITNRPDAATKQTNAKFEVSFDDISVDAGPAGSKNRLTVKIGDKSFKIENANADDALTGAEIASWFTTGGLQNDKGAVEQTDNAAGATNADTAKWDTLATAGGAYHKINGNWYKAAANGNTVTFTQVNYTGDKGEVINPDFDVTTAAGVGKLNGTTNWKVQNPTTGQGVGSSHQAQASVDIDFSKLKDGDKLTIGDKTFTFNLTGAAAAGDIDLSSIFKTEADKSDAAKQEKAMVAITNAMKAAGSTAWSFGNGGAKDGVGTITLQSLSSYVDGTTTGVSMDTEANIMKQIYSERPESAASVSFKLDPTKIKAGDTFTINGQTFEFTDGTVPTDKANTVIDLSAAGIAGGLLPSQTNDVLTAVKSAIEGVFGTTNGAFTVTTDADAGTVTLTSNDDPNGVTTAIKEDRIAAKIELPQGAYAGKGLTLQIGDTSDDYNQLTVNIQDMHADALIAKDEDGNVIGSIGDVDISDQEGAAKAVDIIKNSINTVSDVRGTLGATQNRLDHTINNLSVMTENIQDAESTIRDTDVAEEMMAYTKNNILIQSAQAMLAQANQVPQGVLQLLG